LNGTAIERVTAIGRPANVNTQTSTMDKKAKKRIEVLQPKLQKLRLQLAGAKKQMDDPDEVRKLEAEIAAIESELKGLKES
jgi:hypothetical protein